MAKTTITTRVANGKNSMDDIGQAVSNIFTKAQASRSSKSVHFEKSVDDILLDCHNDRRGILSKDEQGIAAELCHLGLDFGRRKSNQAKDIILDVVRHSIDQPIYEPTNVPSLPASAEKEVLQKVYDELLGEGFVGGLTNDLIKPLKIETLAKYNDEAQKKATLVEKYVRDMLEEMDYDNESTKLIDDFVSMPICIANYPHYEYKEVPKWSGDNWTTQEKLVGKMKRVSPFDFYIVGGDEVEKASAVIETCRVHPSNLEKMIGIDGWYDDQIKEIVLNKSQNTDTYISSYKNKEQEKNSLNNEEIQYIKFYGQLPRALFKGTKVKLDGKESTYVEMIIYAFGKQIIYAKQQKSNSSKYRPYDITAYEKLNGSAYGTGILQRVHNASRIARSMTYAMIRNAGYTAQPTGEMDISRLTEFQDAKDLGSLNLGTFLHAEPDLTGKQGGHTPAVTVYNIPNYMGQYQAGITFFMDIIDLLSAVPKISSGDMRGLATLGRSFRGVAMVQAAESKSTKGALDNYDHDIQERIFLKMYNEMMENTKNKNLKGDVRVKARATSGYTTKEAKAAARSEALQFIAPFADKAPPGAINALIFKVLEDFGVDIERYTGTPTDSMPGLTQPDPTTTQGFGGEKIDV